MLGVFEETGVSGTVTVTASAPGLTSSTVTVTVSDDAGFSSWWCHREPKL